MKASISPIIASACVAVFLLAGCEPKPVTPAPAPAAAAAPVPKIDPKAQAVLKSMSEALDAAQSFSCTVHQMYDSPNAAGRLVQLTRKSEIIVERPDNMSVTTTNGYEFEKKLIHNGKLTTFVDVKVNAYAQEPASPEKIGDMLDYFASKYSIVMPIADLMFPQSYKAMTANVTYGQYIGVTMCGDYKCHQLAFEQPDIDWQVWVDAGEKPLLRKILIINKTKPGMPRYMSVIRDWNLSPKIAQYAFAPQIPAGAKQITLEKMFNIEKGK